MSMLILHTGRAPISDNPARVGRSGWLNLVRPDADPHISEWRRFCSNLPLSDRARICSERAARIPRMSSAASPKRSSVRREKRLADCAILRAGSHHRPRSSAQCIINSRPTSISHASVAILSRTIGSWPSGGLSPLCVITCRRQLLEGVGHLQHDRTTRPRSKASAPVSYFPAAIDLADDVSLGMRTSS